MKAILSTQNAIAGWDEKAIALGKGETADLE
jgi:hypothetical protein